MIPTEMVRSFGVQQHGVSARKEVASGTCDLSDGCVLGYGTEGHVLSCGRIGEVIPYPDEIKVGRDEDQYAQPACTR